jgi:hypothetical protein
MRILNIVRDRPQLAFFAALGLLLGIVAVQYSIKVMKPRKDGQTSSAILRWSKQIQDMHGGENIHAKYNYPNPPVMAQILWPLAKLAEISPLAAALAWFFLKVGMALLCWLWTFRLVETPGRPFPEWAKAIAVALSINPVIGDLKHGNVNLFILLLVMGCLYSFSRGRDRFAGVLLALAIACKVTPALFVVYFLWKRSWNVLIGCGIGLVFFFLVIPSLGFAVQRGSLVEGCEQNWAALTAWVRNMILPYMVHGEVWSERENQSLPGLLTRLFTHSPSFSKWVNDAETPFAYHNVADLSAQTIKRLVQMCQAAFLLLMVIVCRAPVRVAGTAPMEARGGWPLAAEYSIILVGMLLFSERTWKHHCVTLMLPFAVLAFGAFAAGFPTWLRRVALTTLLVAGGAVLLPTVAELVGDGTLVSVGDVRPDAEEIMGLNPNSARELAQVYGAYIVAFLALLVGLVAMLIHRKNYTVPS